MRILGLCRGAARMRGRREEVHVSYGKIRGITKEKGLVLSSQYELDTHFSVKRRSHLAIGERPRQVFTTTSYCTGRGTSLYYRDAIVLNKDYWRISSTPAENCPPLEVDSSVLLIDIYYKNCCHDFMILW